MHQLVPTMAFPIPNHLKTTSKIALLAILPAHLQLMETYGFARKFRLQLRGSLRDGRSVLLTGPGDSASPSVSEDSVCLCIHEDLRLLAHLPWYVQQGHRKSAPEICKITR